MGSPSHPKLPVIDFAQENLKPGTSSWLSTRKDVLHALEEYGCFLAVYNKVPLQLHNALFSALEELFDLPLETKRKNISNLVYFGYLGNEPLLRPLYEGMGITDATTHEGTQDFTMTMWPNGNDHFYETLLTYSKLASELDQMVMRMVFESYGVEYNDSEKESTTYLLRMAKYRVPKKDEANLGFVAHTDKNLITVLHQNEVNGLEVKTKDGQWIRFEPSSSSSFIVMAGDALLAWSNDRIHAPFHQVVKSGPETRYSVGLFSYSKDIIKVPDKLVDDEHPLQFKPFDHFEFLRYAISEAGKGKNPTVKAYCGV